MLFSQLVHPTRTNGGEMSTKGACHRFCVTIYHSIKVSFIVCSYLLAMIGIGSDSEPHTPPFYIYLLGIRPLAGYFFVHFYLKSVRNK